MPPAPLPANEAARLAALHSYGLMYTAHGEALDDLVALAARLTDSPIAQVSLIDAERQWSLSRHGTEVAEVSRDHSFCAHALLEPRRPLTVGNAAADPRFRDSPLVTGDEGIRAYLGVPLVNPEGHALGTLCVADRRLRDYDPETIATVDTLARAVSANLELHRSLLRSREAALTDPLTGLPNRRRMMEALAEAAASPKPVAAIVVDLDHFKEANDGEGHAAGDALLRATAERLSDSVRPEDLVGRIGGDEFLVLISGVVGREVVETIARRISAALHRPVPYGTKSLRLGATLGVAIVPDDVSDPGMALRVADEALIRAKQQARGGVGSATREDEAGLRRVAAILRAFRDDAEARPPLQGARVHLQPVLSLGCAPDAPAQVLALEALARWSAPSVGSVGPESLFALIGPEWVARLGREVRRQALAAFAALRGAGLEHARVALNLSASEVCRDDIVLRIAEEVEQAGLSLRSVEIEITEEVLLDRVSDRTLDQLAALRGRGARLVLDDFGTGNSGLAQLLRLPLDGLKLDKRFVQRLGQDVRADEIVRATISLAHGLGLRVVAEGVETEPQAAWLRGLGCDGVQGYLYARPMPPDRLGEWLRERRRADGPGKVVPWTGPTNTSA